VSIDDHIDQAQLNDAIAELEGTPKCEEDMHPPTTYVYITFGQRHTHSLPKRPTFDKDCVARIKCRNYSHGRERAFQLFGDKWHNAYAAEEFDPSIMRYYPRGIIDV
jgi:hypothetical protein